MINGLIFEERNNTAKNWGQILHGIYTTDGILTGCGLSFDPKAVVMQPGYFILCGRVLQNDDVLRLPVEPKMQNCLLRVRCRIDLHVATSSTEFSQAVWGFDYSGTDSFTGLEQEDLNDIGRIYEVELGVFKIEGGEITAVIRTMGHARLADHALATQANETANAAIPNSKKSSAVNSSSEDTVATSKAVKTAYDRGTTGITNAATAQSTANAAIPNSKKSTSTSSTSTDTVATSSAVKAAYDLANAAIPSGKKSTSTSSASTDTVATSSAVKTAYDLANAAIPNSKKSSDVNSTSVDTVATSKAVKDAYDMGAAGINNAAAAQGTANTAKSEMDRVTAGTLYTSSGSLLTGRWQRRGNMVTISLAVTGAEIHQDENAVQIEGGAGVPLEAQYACIARVRLNRPDGTDSLEDPWFPAYATTNEAGQIQFRTFLGFVDTVLITQIVLNVTAPALHLYGV